MPMIHSLLSLAGKVLTKGKLSILIYHQVFEEIDPMRPTEPVKAEFDWQMKLVSRYFSPLSLTQALKHLKEGTLPANAVCITFDDGYLNNLTVAAPVLKKYNIPATVYCATAFASGENMWNDRLIDLVSTPELAQIDLTSLDLGCIELTDITARRSTAHKLLDKIKYLPIAERKQIVSSLYQENGVSEYPAKMMTPAQTKELHELGVEIGAHTVDHPIMHVLSEQEQEQQVIQSKTLLEQWIGAPVVGFAYPNGKLGIDYDDKTRNVVESAEFDYAVTTNVGVSTKDTDVYQLNRFTPWDKTPLKFHLRMILNKIRSK